MADETAPLMDSGQGSREHGDGGPDDTAPSRWHGFRSRSQVYLASKQKHYFILGLVSLDVMAILTDILVSPHQRATRAGRTSLGFLSSSSRPRSAG